MFQAAAFFILIFLKQGKTSCRKIQNIQFSVKWKQCSNVLAASVYYCESYMFSSFIDNDKWTQSHHDIW